MKSDYFQKVIFVLSAMFIIASSNSDSLHKDSASASDIEGLDLNEKTELSEGSDTSTDYRIFDSVGNVSTLEELILR